MRLLMIRCAGRSRRGAALLLTFFMMLVLSGLAAAGGIFSRHSLVGAQEQLLDQQAFYLAEAGWQRARQQLLAGNWTAAASPGNTYTESFGAGQYQVTVVDDGGGSYTVTSNGYVPNAAAPLARRQLAVSGMAVTSSNGSNYSLTATATASSSTALHLPLSAMDGLTTTYWEADTKGSGQWLKLDFGGSPPTINTIVIEENNHINGITIEWSDDDASWSTPSSLSLIESPSKTWTATFTAGSHRYVRATLTASGAGNRVSVEEMSCYDSALSALGNGTVATQW